VYLLSLKNGEQRRLSRPDAETFRNIGDRDPDYSPDGRLVAFVRQQRYIGSSDLYLVAVEDGEETRLTSDGADMRDVAWSQDGRSLVFASERAGLQALWQISRQGGNLSRLLIGDGADAVSISRERDRLVYTRMLRIINIYRVAGPAASERSAPEKLISATGFNADPLYSPDGSRIVFASRRSGQPEIWKIPAQGGEPRQITRNGGVNALESSDGRYLYYASHEQTREARIWRMPLAGGESTLVLDWGPDYMNWDLWQDKVVYLDPRGEHGPILRMIDPDSGQVTNLAELRPEARATIGLGVSPDGQWVAFSRRDVADSDLVLVENFRID
jgi:Tol biopolymer transport system component